MKWKKEKIKDNDGKDMPCWRSYCKTYLICQNINDGKPGKLKGDTDKEGYRWLFEITKINGKGEETAIGTSPTLKAAKVIAECDEEGV